MQREWSSPSKTIDQGEADMNDPQIAKTILAQMGGNRFVAMTGAKNLLDLGRGLQFKIPSRKANVMRVELGPNDTYRVRFDKIKGFDAEVVAELEGLHAEDLIPIFERYTGMYARL